MAVDPDKELDPELKASLNRSIDQRIVDASRRAYDALNRKINSAKRKIEELSALSGKNRVAIIASKGSLDMAYPPLLLAGTYLKEATKWRNLTS